MIKENDLIVLEKNESLKLEMEELQRKISFLQKEIEVTQKYIDEKNLQNVDYWDIIDARRELETKEAA